MKAAIKIMFLIIVSIILQSCAHSVKDLPLSESLIRNNNENVIVFVHGINGNLKDTWTNHETNAFWPELMSQDPEFNNFDIISINYYSDYFNNDFTISELGIWLNIELSNMRVLGNDKYKNIVFIAHSQGNLIIRSALYHESEKYKDKRVALIISLASPSEGSTLAYIGNSILPNNVQFSNLSSYNNRYVKALNSVYLMRKGHTRISCAYEKVDYNSIVGKVVDKESSTAVCSGAIVPFYADHTSISKPRDQNDRIYVWVKTEILSIQNEGFFSRNNFRNAYSNFVSFRDEHYKGITLDDLIKTAKKYTPDKLDNYLISDVPLLEEKIPCEEFEELFSRVVYQDRISVLRSVSTYIKKPISEKCSSELINKILYTDRSEANTLLNQQ